MHHWINKDGLKSSKLSETSSEAEQRQSSLTDFQGISQSCTYARACAHNITSGWLPFISPSLDKCLKWLEFAFECTLAGLHVSESASQLLSVTTWRNGACHDSPLRWESLLFSLEFPSASPQSSPKRKNPNVATSKICFWMLYLRPFDTESFEVIQICTSSKAV